MQTFPAGERGGRDFHEIQYAWLPEHPRTLASDANPPFPALFLTRISSEIEFHVEPMTVHPPLPNKQSGLVNDASHISTKRFRKREQQDQPRGMAASSSLYYIARLTFEPKVLRLLRN